MYVLQFILYNLSYFPHRFSNKGTNRSTRFYRDLKGWIHTMTILVTNDELAKDVVGAEALLDRHRVRSFPWMMNLFYEICNGIIFLITHHAA